MSTEHAADGGHMPGVAAGGPGHISRIEFGITIEDLRNLVATCDPDSLMGARDRALLVLCFAGAFRRSELVSLDVKDRDRDKAWEVTPPAPGCRPCDRTSGTSGGRRP
jgi:integrase